MPTNEFNAPVFSETWLNEKKTEKKKKEMVTTDKESIWNRSCKGTVRLDVKQRKATQSEC